MVSQCDLFNVCIFLLLHFISASDNVRKHHPTPTPYHDWDYLMFSQRWPVTGCSQWEEQKEGNTCNMPPDKRLWTVHGLWPTKTGTTGPLYCPSAIHFDPGMLDPMMNDLKSYWTNIEAGTQSNSFWKHEWEKHGTCAVILPILDSIPNYFQQTLKLNKEYKISEMLTHSNISPGSNNYTIEEIYNAIKLYINVSANIQCVIDQHTKEFMLSEVRLCFNKSLELIDCDQTNPVHLGNNSIITNCSRKKPVKYLASIPQRDPSYEIDYIDNSFKRYFEDRLYYLRIYRALKFLIWFTT